MSAKVSVFTLNCWGIGMGVSRDRVVRMRAIGQHLAQCQYDIVCLQEVWCPEDYQTICALARDVLPYNHFFDHGIIGSGTCILSKEPIIDAAFHEFSLNGYPHKILHGDWFAGKGIGVCNINYRGLKIHVFVSHFHAEYDRSSDIYVGHRVMQALEAAQWIKLTSSGADLTIYAGDFNTEPCDVPYWLLRTVGLLHDTWLECHSSSEGGQTCDTRYNTYSSGGSGDGKRIDYIMYRPGHTTGRVSTQSCELPLARRIPVSLSAALGHEVSYSDHEAVHSVLTIDNTTDHGDNNPWDDLKKHLLAKKHETVSEAIDVIDKAIVGTSFDQKLYSCISLIIWIAFFSTFAQLLSDR